MTMEDQVTYNKPMGFDEVLAKMLAVYANKNHDYGDSFTESCNEFGPIAAIVRMNDKMNRLKSLMRKEARVADESMKDTVLDLANYSAMLYQWLENNR